MPQKVTEKFDLHVQHGGGPRMSKFVIRPDDFMSPCTVVVRCSACQERLVYRVYSTAATARRRIGWTVLTLLGLAAVGLSIWQAGSLPQGTGDAFAGRLLVYFGALPIFILGALRRQNEYGVRGPGVATWWSTAHGTHDVSVGDERVHDSLVCEPCGHAVPMPAGAEGCYEAKRRLAGHQCG